ncbi:MAG: hypothetical protein KC547_14800 [Anaerolineae bacterium]|nr:hypothetical protein [Anaerolineae bacterium]
METWKQIDEYEEAYARLADRRKELWRRLVAHRMAGAGRQADRVKTELERLDYQGMKLAERIAELATFALKGA